MTFDQSLIRVRPGARIDRGGNTVEDWPSATLATIPGLSVQPSAQTETVTGARDHRRTVWRVISEPGNVPDVKATDRFRREANGRTFVVEGDVAVWPSPDGLDHVEFTIVEDTG